VNHAVVVCETHALFGPGPDKEREADGIAAIARMTAYDVKLRLAGVLPAILAWTSDVEEAIRIQKALTERGHGAVVIDPLAVTPSERMPRVRRFSFEPERFKANDRGDGAAWDDITALIQAATVTSVVRRVREREPIYEVGRGRPPASEEREQIRHETAASKLLYICVTDGPPILLVAHEAKYISLGAGMKATEHENFFETIGRLRSRAPGAVFDDRFAERAHDSHKVAVARGSDSVDARSDRELDLLVHALARWLTRGTGSPYRDTGERP
jgi:hypothetical protein